MTKRRHLDNTITIGQLPKEYVNAHGNMSVVTPKGVRTTLAKAYKNYNQTPINPNDVPGLTDYLIKQDQPDISEQAHFNKIAADRFVHQLGKERDQALMAIAAGAFGGGGLASGLVLAPVATLGSIGGGIAGEKVFNKLYGGNWGQDVERWTNGYIPAEYGEYLNPGSLIGGGLGSQVGKIPSLAYQGFLRMPQTKRAVEVAMRTTSAQNPIPYMELYLDELRQTPVGRQQLKDVGKYILFGKRQNDAIARPYRTLAPSRGKRDNSYTGFGIPLDITGKFPKKDLIDAYLYGDEIDSNFLTKVAQGKDFGIHTDYINKFYPNKKGKIQVYEGGLGEVQDQLAFIKPSKGINYNTAKVKGFDGEIRSLAEEQPVNTAGHLILQDAEGNRLAQDIWKFNPSEYNDKWVQSGGTNWVGLKRLMHMKGARKDYIKTYVRDKLPKLGLKLVDDIGTPVVIRSKPFRYKTNNEIFRDNIAAAISGNPSLGNRPVVDFMPLAPTISDNSMYDPRGYLYHIFD